MSMLTVYVGHDSREQTAFDVCVSSIKKRSQCKVVKLSSQDIPEYNRIREQHQSTDFTYTRFFVPYLNKFQGYALFVDCDFVFLDDPQKILYENSTLYWNPVSVCKHPQYIPKTEIKMDGIQQHAMPKKNWASLMLFSCEHPANQILQPDYINRVMPGKKLHQFEWLSDQNHIGSIPLDWNCLDEYYHLSNPKAIHFTDGGPWFENYRHTMYSKYWYQEYHSRIYDTVSSV